ncbi:MAG: hypothetical protein OSJ62_07485 [Lachnospiraceae bacterium]|nr:hypothetical protein [Lachnospiraceae bacterium]
MDERHKRVVAKKVASILAENEATISDIEEILKIVKKHLTIVVDKISRGYLFGIHILDQACDSDGIWDGE